MPVGVARTGARVRCGRGCGDCRRTDRVSHAACAEAIARLTAPRPSPALPRLADALPLAGRQAHRSTGDGLRGARLVNTGNRLRDARLLC